VTSWDARRSPASALLLTRLGEEQGVRPEVVLAGTGLDLPQLLAPSTEVTGRQELTVLRNLVRACGDAPDLALEAGSRYHLTTYGIWGFALASSRTVRDALSVGARFVDLSFTFCSVGIEEEDGELRVCLDDAALPDDVRAFVVTRDLAGLRTLLTELVSSGLPLRSLSLRSAARPTSGATSRCSASGPPSAPTATWPCSTPRCSTSRCRRPTS
jgi:hypothetical protein